MNWISATFDVVESLPLTGASRIPSEGLSSPARWASMLEEFFGPLLEKGQGMHVRAHDKYSFFKWTLALWHENSSTSGSLSEASVVAVSF